MAATKKNAATGAARERRKHQRTRDRLWRRLEMTLDRIDGRFEPDSVGEAELREAKFLLRVLRDTGAK